MLKYLLVGVAAAAGVACLPAESEASEWGCQVLLCLSGNWKGTPSCRPPINKLIAAMKSPGFNWPTCPQAHSSAARFDKYGDCPSGWQVTAQSDSDRPGMRNEADMCQIKADKLALHSTYADSGFGNGHDRELQQVKIKIDGKIALVGVQTIGNGRSPASGRNGTTYFTMSRPLREKPWYIEYDDAKGTRQKSWFSLHMP